MSFYKLLTATQLPSKDFEVVLDSPINLNGEYEVALAEYYISFFRFKLGELTIQPDRKIYKMYYRPNNIEMPKSFKFFDDFIESKTSISYNNDKNILKIECANSFDFNGINSTPTNNTNIIEIKRDLYLNKPQKIFILCNIVNYSFINNKKCQLLKSFIYDGQSNEEFSNEYHDTNVKYIEKITLEFYDSNLEKIYLTKAPQHFLIHFKKK